MQQQGISSRQRGLLEAAFLHNPAAADAWQRWSAEVDWDGYLDHTSFALLPRVYRNLRAQGVDDPIFPRCKGIMRQAWLANQHLIGELGPGLDALAGADVEPLLLPPTWVLAHDRSAVLDRGRPLCFGIAPGQALAAVRALLALGWTMERVRLPAAWLPGYIAGANHLVLCPPRGQRWLLAWGIGLWPGDHALGAAAAPCDLGGRTVRALAPADALCYSLWQPGGLDAFGLAAQLLTIAAVAEVRHWPAAAPAAAALLPHGWEAAAREFAHLFAQWGARPGFGATASVLPGAAPQAGPPQRLAADWQRYRAALSERNGPPTPLRQLPGYLMGRWRLQRPRELPERALRWLTPRPAARRQET